MRKKLSFIILSFFLIALFSICPKQTAHAENKITQINATKTSVEIQWTTPEYPKYEIINWYKVSWEIDGKEKSATISGNSIGLKYTITGLQHSSSYEVTITFEYIDSDGVNHHVTYGSTTVRTSIADASYSVKNLYYSGSRLKMKIRLPHGHFQYDIISGAKIDYSKYYDTNARTYGSVGIYSRGSDYINEDRYVDPKKGVSTFIIRRYVPGDKYTNYDDTCGAWVVKHFVPDPVVTADRRLNDIKVSIKPVKGASSYDVYIGLYTGRSKTDDFIQGKKFVKVRRVPASNKTVTTIIKKYKKQKFKYNKNQFVVRVITNSRYGSSNGAWLTFCE